MTKIELIILQNYLKKNLVNEFIQRSQSLVDVFIIFVKKKNDFLRLCVNYRALKKIIVKNKYSFSLIDESLNRLSKVQIYTQFDLIKTYHRMCIKKENEWKTTFRIKYELFEYRVMSFELANASTTFQTYINKTLTKRANVNVIVFLNDILIYFENSIKHDDDVIWVFKLFIKHDLYISRDKCRFKIKKVQFLNYMIFLKEIIMQ